MKFILSGRPYRKKGLNQKKRVYKEQKIQENQYSSHQQMDLNHKVTIILKLFKNRAKKTDNTPPT